MRSHFQFSDIAATIENMKLKETATAKTTNQPKANNPDRHLSISEWLLNYSLQDLPGDLMAGAVVAIMLVPQSMAYSLLAGLPPEVGLYASILPLILYPLLGTSRALAVGPVSMVSLLVAAGIEKLADRNSPEYLTLALTLAAIVGLIKLGMGLTRLGFLFDFLSHSVIVGFTFAAALTIGCSQVKDLIGVTIPQSEQFSKLVVYLLESSSKTNFITLAIGIISILILIYFNRFLEGHLKHWGISDKIATLITKSSPLVVVILGTLLVWAWRLDETAGVKIVGTIPSGLPTLTWPFFDGKLWQSLFPVAFTISVVGFLESIAIAKSLASSQPEKVDANRELVALGVANLGAAVTGGYPVTGGLSRSVVNLSAGANTGLASIIAALLVALTVQFFTPLFYFLPKTSLAAIIIVAVLNLIDIATFKTIWHESKAEATLLLITFVAVLTIGIETGIAVGILSGVILYFWRNKTQIGVWAKSDRE